MGKRSALACRNVIVPSAALCKHDVIFQNKTKTKTPRTTLCVATFNIFLTQNINNSAPA